MRAGDTRLGSARFGSASVTGASHPSRVEVATSGHVTRLSTEVSASGTAVETTAGSLTQHDVDVSGTTVSRWRISSVTADDIVAEGQAQPAITVNVGGWVGDRTLTTRARYPDLIETVSPRRNIPERERIEGYLKRPFETGYPAAVSGGVRGPGEFSKLIDLFGESASLTFKLRDDVLLSHYVDLAKGKPLDEIGKLLLLPRRTGEKDQHYRLRLKAYARSLTGEATIDQVRETLALLLECNVRDIDLTEPDTCARFDIMIDQSILDEANATTQDVVDLVTRFKAGGVLVTLSVSGSFQHKSAEDLNQDIDIGEHGYNESTYSGRIV